MINFLVSSFLGKNEKNYVCGDAYLHAESAKRKTWRYVTGEQNLAVEALNSALSALRRRLVRLPPHGTRHNLTCMA